MSRRSQPEENPIKSFCDLLGRQHFLSGFLDWVAGWLLPSAAAALPGGGHRRRSRPLPDAWRLFMAEGPMTGGPALQAPPWDPNNAVEPEGYQLPRGVSEQKKRPRERALSSSEKSRGHRLSAMCAQPQYRGMFGQPCKLLSGSDTMCPEGSVSGWFWKYQTPVGVIYYVDCCGKKALMYVTCNWTIEQSWCLAGRAMKKGVSGIYTCTLAVPDKQMRTRKNPEDGDAYAWVEGVEYQPPEPGTGAGSRASYPDDADDPRYPQ